MTIRRSMLCAAILFGCRASDPQSIPTPDSDTPEASAEAAAARCPLVPLRLLVTGPDLPAEQAVLELDARGDIRMALAGPTPVARFDDAGCIIGPDAVWVELTRDEHMWTQRQLVALRDGALTLGADRHVFVDSDGRVGVTDAAGNPEDSGEYALRFEGDLRAGHCAARLLLMAYLGTMPSMAAVDGVAPVLPPPADSVCPTP